MNVLFKFRFQKLFFLGILGIFLSLFAGCRHGDKPIIAPADFQHELSQGPKPWTSETFKPSNKDFTFAIISDLNGGERPGVYTQAVQQLNMLDPRFVLSVGDLIDGGTEDTLLLYQQWKSFDNRTAKLNMPFFYLGGNHDLTNPTMRDFWNDRLGPTYYHFLYKDVLFLMLDSEDFEPQRMLEIYQARAEAIKIINGEIEGNYEDSEYYKMPERRVGGMSKEQQAYFKKVLEQHPEVRWTFLLMHKPLWQREDDKGLSYLENLLKDRPYSLFNGHIHSFSHQLRMDKDYTILGTTGGSQNPDDPRAFDHITLIRMEQQPVITHLKLSGILDKSGTIPAGN